MRVVGLLDRTVYRNGRRFDTDPTDISLYDGKAYFMTDEKLKEQLAIAPKTEPASFFLKIGLPRLTRT